MKRRGRHPRLLISIELESDGVLLLDCDSSEDERRLRAWLRRSVAFAALPALLEQLLDDLDDLDDERSAA